MRRAPHPRTKSSKSSRQTREKSSFRRAVERDVAAKIERARQRRDAEQRIPKGMERRVRSKATRAELKAHGFRTTKRGVVVDGPRDRKREPIPGSKVEVMRGGVIKTSVGARRDFIYGFTAKEKREFARDPAAMERKILARLRKQFPSLAKARKPQTRLQWGAYQATKDFSPTYFTAKYFAAISPEETRREGKRGAKPRIDKLTGFHVVIHVPTKAGKRQGVHRGKKKQGRKRK
jgi:hypothetical protein